MTQSEKKQYRDEIYKIINTILLSFISIFGVYSLILLSNLKEAINNVQRDQAVQQEKVIAIEKRIDKTEEKFAKLQSER